MIWFRTGAGFWVPRGNPPPKYNSPLLYHPVKLPVSQSITKMQVAYLIGPGLVLEEIESLRKRSLKKRRQSHFILLKRKWLPSDKCPGKQEIGRCNSTATSD